MAGVRCSFWEFGAIVRHERQRHAAGLVRGAHGRAKFVLPSFLTSRDSGLELPEVPSATVAEAEASARRKGWIGNDDELDDLWYGVVTTLMHGPQIGFVQVGDPEADEIRVMVALQRGSGFRVWMQGENVVIDEVPADAAWKSLVACLPERGPADGRPVSVNSELLAEASARAEQHRGDAGEAITYELRSRDVAADKAKAVGAFQSMADRTTAQIGVAVRESDSDLRFGPFVINTHHTPSGRVAMFQQPPQGTMTTLAPADSALLAKTTQQYVDLLREQVADEQEDRRMRW